MIPMAVNAVGTAKRLIDLIDRNGTCMFLLIIVSRTAAIYVPRQFRLSHRHLRDSSSRDRLLVIHPSMSSGIWWSWSLVSEGVTILVAHIGWTGTSVVQLTKHTYWRLISQPSDIGSYPYYNIRYRYFNIYPESLHNDVDSTSIWNALVSSVVAGKDDCDICFIVSEGRSI